jgi:hypothetical protein
MISAAGSSKIYAYLYHTTGSHIPGESTSHTAAIISILIYRVSMRIPEGNRPLERPRRRWKNTLKSIFNK